MEEARRTERKRRFGHSMVNIQYYKVSSMSYESPKGVLSVDCAIWGLIMIWRKNDFLLVSTIVKKMGLVLKWALF